MFQSIYRVKYNSSTDQYIYNLIDSNFECYAMVTLSLVTSSTASVELCAVPATISEYQKRNYSHKDIVKNIVLLNMFLIKEYPYYESIDKIIKIQEVYIDHYFQNINFSKLYYQDVKDCWNKTKNLQ